MSVAPLKKPDMAGSSEIAPPADALAASGSLAKATEVPAPARSLPSWLKLPPAKPVLASAWPPMARIAGFLLLWAIFAPMVKTSLGTLPGPGDVWQAFLGLMDEHFAARAEAAAAGANYTGPPTFIDQIFTSLKTVAMGFTLASLGVTLQDIVTALDRKNGNVGAGYIEKRGEQYLILAPGKSRHLRTSAMSSSAARVVC